eukprot:UN22447
MEKKMIRGTVCVISLTTGESKYRHDTQLVAVDMTGNEYYKTAVDKEFLKLLDLPKTVIKDIREFLGIPVISLLSIKDESKSEPTYHLAKNPTAPLIRKKPQDLRKNYIDISEDF